MTVAIVGAGIAGRLLAWRLAKLGYRVELFDKNKRDDECACSFAAAGILSPLAELEMAEPDIYQYGSRSMKLYQEWLPQLTQDVFFKVTGSLVTAHGSDKIELDHFYRQVQRKTRELKIVEAELKSETIEKVSVETIEPELAHLGQGLYIPSEGQIDPIELLKALAFEIDNSVNVNWHNQAEVSNVSAHKLKCGSESLTFDWVFDCRGLGAKGDLPLRAVRGELLWLESKDVNIKHLTRLIHPRYRIYVVPRPNDIYLVGATEIQSEDFSPVSVRSSLELLSAAYSVHRGFGEARIVKSVVNCRPALTDNLPLIDTTFGLTRVNGLYRHGILMSPAVIEKAIREFKHISNHDLEKVQHAN
ncbi:FAD-dependent oxidoreductase [Kangiella japonica]